MREVGVLAVWKLDPLGRSLAHLIETVAAFEKGGGGFPQPSPICAAWFPQVT
jgi:DNA invertase Pin-like site-specific DNA recombinase